MLSIYEILPPPTRPDRDKEVTMKTGQPSATATIMAFHRALEMLYPEAERVCQDPLAAAFLPSDWAELLHNRE